MALQVLSVVGGIISVGGFFVWLGRVIYRQASAPKGYAVVLTGLSLVTFTTLAAVVALFFLR